jgi:hypothetical protein
MWKANFSRRTSNNPFGDRGSPDPQQFRINERANFSSPFLAVGAAGRETRAPVRLRLLRAASLLLRVSALISR